MNSEVRRDPGHRRRSLLRRQRAPHTPLRDVRRHHRWRASTITRNGRPAAVLINPADLEALEETLDVLSDPAAMQRLREGEAAVAAGDVVDEAGLRDLVVKRTR